MCSWNLGSSITLRIKPQRTAKPEQNGKIAIFVKKIGLLKRSGAREGGGKHKKTHGNTDITAKLKKCPSRRRGGAGNGSNSKRSITLRGRRP